MIVVNDHWTKNANFLPISLSKLRREAEISLLGKIIQPPLCVGEEITILWRKHVLPKSFASFFYFYIFISRQDPDDLPFRKGEILTVVSKDEEQWWTARNSIGQTGSIPVPYICKVSWWNSNNAAGWTDLAAQLSFFILLSLCLNWSIKYKIWKSLEYFKY